MAVPFRRTSKTKKRMRRTHLKKSAVNVIACPKCGETDLHYQGTLDEEHDEKYYFVMCKACGWSDWTQ